MRNFEKSPNPPKKFFFWESALSQAGFPWDIVGISLGYRGTSWYIVVHRGRQLKYSRLGPWT